MAAACCSSLSDPVRLTVIGFGRRGFTTNERSYIFLGRQSSDPSRRLLFSSLPGQAVTWSDRHLKPSAAVINAAEHAQTFLDDLQLGTWMVAADIDPATAKLAIGVLGPFLSAFAFLFIIRIVMSWYPKLPVGKFPYVVAYAPTEPILAVTRKVIPPLAGVDVTPVVWFGLVSFLNEILVGPQGLLVLISQQVN